MDSGYRAFALTHRNHDRILLQEICKPWLLFIRGVPLSTLSVCAHGEGYLFYVFFAAGSDPCWLRVTFMRSMSLALFEETWSVPSIRSVLFDRGWELDSKSSGWFLIKSKICDAPVLEALLVSLLHVVASASGATDMARWLLNHPSHQQRRFMS